MKPTSLNKLALLLLTGIFLVNCSGKKTLESAADAGQLRIDGSSTVYPITEAVAKKYKTEFDNLIISIGVSGTGGGFEKFLSNEVQINNASRKIKDKEIAKAKELKLGFKEIEVAYDGIAIVVNKDNTWVDQISVDELKQLCSDNSARLWSDIRYGWPETPFKLYGPGEASGTHDYFKEVILGEDGFRKNFIKSENDNLLVKGIAFNEGAIGFFGLGYFEENKEDLKLIPVDNGIEAVLPTQETISLGSYSPLSRTMFIYANDELLKDAAGKGFLKYYLENASEIVKSVGYVPLPTESYKASIANL